MDDIDRAMTDEENKESESSDDEMVEPDALDVERASEHDDADEDVPSTNPEDLEIEVVEEDGGQLVFSLELGNADLTNSVLRTRKRQTRWGAGGRVFSVSETTFDEIPEVPQPLSKRVDGSNSRNRTPPPVVDISSPPTFNPSPHRIRSSRTFDKRAVAAVTRANADGENPSSKDSALLGFVALDDDLEAQQEIVTKRSDTLMKAGIAAAVMFMALVGGIALFGGGDGSEPAPTALAMIAVGDETGRADPVELPDELTYTITETDNVEGDSRSMDVVLSQRITAAQLEKLATELRGEPGEFNRVFIGFMIDGQEDTSWYWATTVFDPSITIRING